jgi:cation-transporting ATPase E
MPPTPENGLTAEEVASRVAAGRVNRAKSNATREYLDILRRNTLTVFNALVVPAAVALFLLEDYRGAWAVSAMAVANTVIGLTHELRAKWHLEHLSLLGESKVRVRRDGQEQVVASGEVVQDDCVLLATGDTVVADGRLVRADFLEIDEALLTGESDPVPHDVGDRVLSGSVCVAGEGEYVAEKVGGESFANQTSAAARQYRYQPGPTQRTLDRLVSWLTVIAVVLCLGYGVLYFVRGFSTTELVQMVAATITSMVPQGLVLLTTLVFVLGAVRLSRTGAVVQRLSAIESMAAVDLICTDKTGTLTTGRQAVDRVVPFEEDETRVRGWIAAFAHAGIDKKNKSIEAIRAFLPDPPGGEVLDQLPFKSQNRYSAVRVRVGAEERVLVLGSFEALKDHFPEEKRGPVEKTWQELLASGLRLLAFADGPADGNRFDGKLPDVRFRPLALVALRDELRPEAAAVLQQLREQGIHFKVVSGDNPETVRATVREVSAVLDDDRLVTGDEWAKSPDRAAVAERVGLFGRVAPEQKLALVETLQKNGRHVGMIGDGVNDILPIKRADFGVAMGAGSPATKAVAGIVLETNDFGTLPRVLAEGRCVVQNVRRAAKLFLLKNVYTVALVLIAVGVCGLPFPYLPQQVTLLNALTIGGPALIILSDRTARTTAVRAAFFADVGRFVLTAGAATSAVAVGLYLWLGSHADAERVFARTVVLSVLILAGVGNAVVAANEDRKLFLWAVVALPLYAAAMYWPLAADFFVLHPLSLPTWAGVVTAAACTVVPTAVAMRPQPR